VIDRSCTNKSLLRLGELLVREDGIMKEAQIETDWWDNALVISDGTGRYMYCSKKGYEKLGQLLPYTSALIPQAP